MFLYEKDSREYDPSYFNSDPACNASYNMPNHNVVKNVQLPDIDPYRNIRMTIKYYANNWLQDMYFSQCVYSHEELVKDLIVPYDFSEFLFEFAIRTKNGYVTHLISHQDFLFLSANVNNIGRLPAYVFNFPREKRKLYEKEMEFYFNVDGLIILNPDKEQAYQAFISKAESFKLKALSASVHSSYPITIYHRHRDDPEFEFRASDLTCPCSICSITYTPNLDSAKNPWKIIIANTYRKVVYPEYPDYIDKDTNLNIKMSTPIPPEPNNQNNLYLSTEAFLRLLNDALDALDQLRKELDTNSNPETSID